MASAYLTKTFSSSGTSDKITTISFWCKRATTSTENSIITANATARDFIRFESSGAFKVYLSGGSANLQTSKLFRDTSAWYHIVVAFDTTQATSSNRIKIYVNGTQISSFSTSTYPAQNTTLKIGTANPNHIGNDSEQTTPYFDGLMTHFHLIDGTAYQASDFGETDSTSGIWKPKTAPSVTYGTNGFFLKFENSGAMGTDSSGNGNNFTVSGTLTQNVDSPSNNFATMNPLDNYYASGSFSNGNNTITTVNTGYPYNTATIGISSGKWYWECKWSAQPTGSTNQVLIGIAKRVCPSTTTWLGSVAYTYAYQGTGTVHQSDTTIATYTTMSVGDIIGVALDLDNNRLYFSKNGTWQGSSDPANGTNPISITAPDSTSGDSGFYFPAFGDGNNNLQETGQFNFGNGRFGTTALASSNSDSAGLGAFEYSVPSGYYSLCTKNIKDYG